MTPRYVYPRLSTIDAEAVLAQLGETPEFAFFHDKAAPFASGAPVPEDVLETVRDALIKAVSPWAANGPRPLEVAAWDRAVGQALYESMQVLPADAAHGGIWAFLTLVLLPDIAVKRFSDRHRDRMLGRSRNVFSRTWWRHHVLCDVETPEGVDPLGEDELVGIFERGRMSRNNDIAVELARVILDHKGSDRSEFARRLSKRVRAQSGPLLLDVLGREQLKALVSELAEREVPA